MVAHVFGMSRLSDTKIGFSVIWLLNVVCFGVPKVLFKSDSSAYRFDCWCDLSKAFEMMRSIIGAVSSRAIDWISFLVMESICKIKSLHWVCVMPLRFNMVANFKGLPFGLGDWVPGFHLNDSR